MSYTWHAKCVCGYDSESVSLIAAQTKTMHTNKRATSVVETYTLPWSIYLNLRLVLSLLRLSRQEYQKNWLQQTAALTAAYSTSTV